MPAPPGALLLTAMASIVLMLESELLFTLQRLNVAEINTTPKFSPIKPDMTKSGTPRVHPT